MVKATKIALGACAFMALVGLLTVFKLWDSWGSYYNDNIDYYGNEIVCRWISYFAMASTVVFSALSYFFYTLHNNQK